MKKLLTLFVLALTLMAQTPIKIVDGTGKELGLGPGGLRYISYMAATATTGTTITSTATYVQLLFCSNTTASAVTVDIADTQQSPVVFVNDLSVAANSIVMIVSDATGLYMQGVKITPSANTSLYCQVQGVQ